MKTFTHEQVVAELQAVIAEKGADFVYDRGPHRSERCKYVKAGAPSCLVGHLLARWEVPLEVMAKVDDGELEEEVDWSDYLSQVEAGAADFVEYLERAGYVHLGKEDRVLLGRAQDAQDQGLPWGEALEYALSDDYDDVGHWKATHPAVAS